MSVWIAIVTVLLLAVVVLLISAPLRTGWKTGPDTDRRAELEAAREGKYREIRDAELDFRTGKLSREDHQTIDAELRAEALEILDRLQANDASMGESEASAPNVEASPPQTDTD
ncbi:MAG TPA: hypothetical protein VID48_15275 [Solirubrobacteraceae bacterium]|jgi:hypothetical protein